MNFPFGKSILRKAIERGLANGKLDEEIRELGDLKLKSRAFQTRRSTFLKLIADGEPVLDQHGVKKSTFLKNS